MITLPFLYLEETEPCISYKVPTTHRHWLVCSQYTWAVFLPTGRLIAAERQPSYSWSYQEILVRWFDPSFALRNTQSEILLYGGRSLANEHLSYKKNGHVLAQRKIMLAQRKSHVLAASYINQNTVDQSQGFAVYSDQSQGFAVYMCRVARRIISLFIIAKYSKIPLLRFVILWIFRF